ncbi:GTP 3',8-cyclase MoaA [Acetonema longum]|uniref:GTP 3',8-cyclase n=1 Tax=Acetonema longum DSM 6540 TaxID=1009370 RepID=F7NQ37_9FIRM|nr:GTP 3',8-cyclase MoaA [Acetonema longum]EGO61796.1 GTP cyclohydrolase subunit MoaA [Acetonema longum DSM 6540]
MRDGFNRNIEYIRVSVTDRCNFRCLYCMPAAGVRLLEHADILTYEEILRLLSLLGRAGFRRVRLTGGEPLIRKGFADFVREVAALRYFEDIAVTTNGSLLAEMAFPLKAAGLKRVNISLDTVNVNRFSHITGGGKLSRVIEGVEAALLAGLSPVKLNVVLTDILQQSDISYFVDLVQTSPVSVRFIEYMPISQCDVSAGMSIPALKQTIETLGGLLTPTSMSYANGPAKYFRLSGSKGTFGFITPISEHFCGSCNRVRLTADGKIKPCLLSNQEYDIKTALRGEISDKNLLRLLERAITAKPAGHDLVDRMNAPGFCRNMSQIGG